MNVTTRIVKNSSLLIIASFINNLIAFLLTLVTARYLGTAKFGIISSATSMVGIFGVLCDLGLSTYAIREVSRNKKLTGIYFGTVGFLRIISSLITLITFIIFIIFCNFSSIEFYVMLLFGIYMVFNSFVTYSYSIFQSNEQMKYQTIGNIVYSISLFLIILLIIVLKGDVILVTAGYPIAIILAFIYTMYIIWKNYPRLQVCFKKEFLKKILVNGIPFGVSNVFTSIYFWIPSILLTFLSGSIAVGLFSSSQKLLLVLASIFTLLSNAIFPVMSQIYKEDKNKLTKIFSKIMKYMFMIGLPISVGTCILSKDITIIIYGKEFINASLSLAILIWSGTFMFLSGTCNTLLGAINKQVTAIKITSIGATFNIILNIILIPHFSYIGASITSVLTELLILLLMIKAIHFSDIAINIQNSIKPTILIIISNIIMSLIISFLKLNTILLIILGAIIYIIMIFITKAVDREDKSILKSLIKKNKY